MSFTVYLKNPLFKDFATLQEALDEACKCSGEEPGKVFFVIEELASVQSIEPDLPPIQTTITSIKSGFQAS